MKNDIILLIKFLYSLLYPVLVFLVVGVVLYISIRRGSRWSGVFASAFTVLLLNALYNSILELRYQFTGIPKPEPYFPLIDHTMETLFLVLIVYALMRVIWKQHISNVNFFLFANLAITLLLAFVIGRSYINTWHEGMLFGNHWGDHVFEVYHAVLILSSIYLLVSVGMKLHSTGTLLIGTGFLLLFISHINHIYNLLTASNENVFWFILEHAFNIVFVLLLGIGLVMRDSKGKSFIERFETEVSTVEKLKQRISDLEELQRRISESEKKYRTLVETMNEGVVVVDSMGKIHYCNSFFSNMIGRSNEEIIGSNISRLLDDANLKVFKKKLNSSHPFELEWYVKEGEKKPTLVSTTPYNNSISGTLCTIADLTTTKYYKTREELKTVLSSVLPLLFERTSPQIRDVVIRKLSIEVEKLIVKKLGGKRSLKEIGEIACSMMNEIGGKFTIHEVVGGYEVVNIRCPWGEKVHYTYCMLTRSIFTRIFSRYNHDVYVQMEKTLGNQDDCCKLIIKSKNKSKEVKDGTNINRHRSS